MLEPWYYAEGEDTRGPISAVDLVALLSKIPDPRTVMIWRHGFEEWKPTDEVPEIARQVVRPPPLRPKVPPPSVGIREPAVDASDAAEFKDVRPVLSGLGGWLALLAFGEVAGLLRGLAAMGDYYNKADPTLWSRFPITMWGEAVLNGAAVLLNVYAVVLLFRRSRHFPRFFQYQFAATIFMPAVGLLWVASTISIAAGQPFLNFLTLDAKDGGQMIAGVIGAMIWLPYISRSRRAANTFIN
jgi:Protein of unknown function (DUF2569)/GYF domain 2